MTPLTDLERTDPATDRSRIPTSLQVGSVLGPHELLEAISPADSTNTPQAGTMIVQPM